jgi:hypothetical protein
MLYADSKMRVGRKTKKRRSGVRVNDPRKEKSWVFDKGIKRSPTTTKRTVYGSRVFFETKKVPSEMVSKLRRERRMESISDMGWVGLMIKKRVYHAGFLK